MKAKHLLYKRFLLPLFALVLVIGFSNNLNANHIRGLEISYQCTDTPQVYKVTIKVYRDCSEIELCPNCSIPSPNGTVSGCTTSNTTLITSITGLTTGFLGINYGSFVLNAVGSASGYDIINTCDSIKTVCTNCNTRTAGTFSPGIEVYTFEGNVNLSSIPSACCRVELGAYFCCRGTALTHVTSSSVYSFAQLNRCQSTCNSAPIFTNNSNMIVCSGVDYAFNLGANDPDGDSLSYTFGSIYNSFGTPATYLPPFSASYYPIPFLGAPNAYTPYPAGIRIDPITGDVLFRPVGVFIVQLIIEVTQWKKISGVPTNVGVTRRDVELQTQICLGNRAPLIKAYKNGILQMGNYNTILQNTVTAGQQICLDIVAQDLEYPNNVPPVLADTTDLKWNNLGLTNPVMANATFTRNYILANRGINGPKADSFKFCWTPPINAARYEPYLFTVSGSDRYCPLKAIATRGIKIKVDIAKTILIENTTKQIFCNNRINTTNVYYKRTNILIFPGNVYTVQLSDSTGSFLGATTIGTKTSIDSVGFIPISIPANLFLNSHYKIRVIASSDTISKGTPFDINFVAGFSTPVITNNRDSFCQGLISTFKVTPNTAGLTYRWLKNNQVIANETKDSLLVDSTFTYRTIVSNAGCADTSNAKYLTVYPKPIAGFIAPNTFCIGNTNQTVSLTNTSTINSGSMSYNWLFNNITNTTVTNPNLSVTDSSNFSIKLLVTSNKNCVDSITKNISFRLAPKAIFTINDSTQCVNGNSFVFTNLSDSFGQSMQYVWSFGTGININTGYNPQTFSYIYASNYGVKLKAIAANGCVDSVTKLVSVFPKPIPNFNTPTSVCLGNNATINLTNSSTLNPGTMSYNWVFGNNTNSNLTNPNLTVSDTGNMAIKLIVTSNNGCIDSVTKTVTVLKSPKALFTINDSTQCLTGNSFVFTNSSDSFSLATQYDWNFGTGNNVNANYNSQIFNYANEGNYGVKLKAISTNGCIDSVTKIVSVFPKPIANFSNPSLFCLGNNSTANLTNTSALSSGTMSYNWFFGNNTNSNLTNPNLTVSDTGNMVIKLIAISNNGCIDSVTKTVNFQKSPKAIFTINDSTQCLNGNSFVFTNVSDSIGLPIQFVWNFGTGNNVSTDNNPQIVSYSNTGNYAVKLKAISANGCTDSTTKSMNVFDKPSVVNFSINNAVQCFKNNNFVFTNQSLPNNNTLLYLWKFGDGDFSTNVSPTKKYLTDGSFTVTLVVNSNSACVDSITKNIFINVNPIAAFSVNNATQCFKGNSFSFTNTTPNTASQHWDFGNSSTSTLANSTKTYTLMGNYQVRLIVNGINNCSDTVTKTINVVPSANLYFNINNAVQCISGNQFVFTNTSNINIGTAQYNWVLGEADTLIGTQVTKQFNKTGSFEIKLLSLTDQNCAENLSKSIVVNAKSAIGKIIGDSTPTSIYTPYTYSVMNQSNTTYNWFITNGLVLSGQGTNILNVVWTNTGKGSLKAKITSNNSCTDSTNLLVNIKGVGINNISLENDLKVFPNPSKSVITITNKNNLVGKNFIISNLVGQLLLSGKLNLDETMVNLETLQSGMYFLSLEGMNKQSIKVIKE